MSKLGDNSDGSSWEKAFHSLQAALSAIPDAGGGHRIIVRPDTYAEANLYPAHKGAPGAYNTLEGDWDGGLEALAHPAARPDFHRRDGFALTLPG